jgi:hypothetical protein
LATAAVGNPFSSWRDNGDAVRAVYASRPQGRDTKGGALDAQRAQMPQAARWRAAA